jgi:flagellar biogenesis protein FliO
MLPTVKPTCYRVRAGNRLIRYLGWWLVLVWLCMGETSTPSLAKRARGDEWSGGLRQVTSAAPQQEGAPAPAGPFADPAIYRPAPRTAGSLPPDLPAPGTNGHAAAAFSPPIPRPANTQLASPVQAASHVAPASLDIPLKPTDERKGELKKPGGSWSSSLSMIVSLLIVIGLFLMTARMFRGLSPTPLKQLPTEVVQVLGRTPLAPRQQMYVLRFGRKLVLISQQLGQTTTLSEIEDPKEVDHLLGLCEQNSPSSISNSFRDILHGVMAGPAKETGQAKSDRPSAIRPSRLDSLG